MASPHANSIDGCYGRIIQLKNDIKIKTASKDKLEIEFRSIRNRAELRFGNLLFKILNSGASIEKMQRAVNKEILNFHNLTRDAHDSIRRGFLIPDLADIVFNYLEPDDNDDNLVMEYVDDGGKAAIIGRGAPDDSASDHDD